MNDKVLVSTMVYALSRQFGFEAALHEVNRQLEEPRSESLPVVRTIGRFRQLADTQVYVDQGAAAVGKARSRAFHVAFESGLPWVSCDDDVEATTDTLAHLLDALETTEPQVVVVPCFTRPTATSIMINIEPSPLVFEREMGGRRTVHGYRLRRVLAGGFGLVGVNRAAMVAIVEHWDQAARRQLGEDLWYTDHDGVKRLGVFLETIRDGKWIGEDVAFFRRLPSSVRVEALLTGTTAHAGETLQLSQVEGILDGTDRTFTIERKVLV